VDASGKHHEPTASSIEAAKAKADELAQMHGLPSSTKTFSHLINDYLVTRRPDGWFDSYVNGMRDLAKAFYPIYGVACGALTQAHPEATIEAIRAAGLMPQTEIHTMRLWGRLVKHGRLWDYLAVTEDKQPLKPRTVLRKVESIKRTGEDEKVWHRDELPSWAYCDAAE